MKSAHKPPKIFVETLISDDSVMNQDPTPEQLMEYERKVREQYPNLADLIQKGETFIFLRCEPKIATGTLGAPAPAAAADSDPEDVEIHCVTYGPEERVFLCLSTALQYLSVSVRLGLLQQLTMDLKRDQELMNLKPEGEA